MKLTTGYDFQGYYITEYIDVFFDEILVGIGFGKGIMSQLDNLFSSLSGGEATEMIEKLNSVKGELRKRVIAKAERAGANALIGIDFESSKLGDLLMVSMTATAVKIEKILEPLPVTEEARARIREQEELAEKARKEEERRKELQKKIENGELGTIDRELIMQNTRSKGSVKEMLEELNSVLSARPDLLSDEQMNELNRCKETERVYGVNVGISKYVKKLRSFLYPGEAMDKVPAVDPIIDQKYPNRIICPECRTPQPKGRKNCFNCGIPFITEP